LLLLVLGLIVLVLLITIASYRNTGKYYVREKDGAVEVWQGRFAPTTKRRLLTLPGIRLPESVKPVYTRSEVYPLAFQYYINKADSILLVPGLPDFDSIKGYLHEALTYEATDDLQRAAYRRITGIDIMVLMYKADVAASRGTPADLKAALDYLHEADTIDLDSNQSEVIRQKVRFIKKALKALQAAPLSEP